MNKLQQRQLDRLKRVAAFFGARDAEFAEGSRAKSLLAEVNSVLSEVESQKGNGSKAAPKTSGANKKALLNDLREELVAIEKTARAIESHNPDFTGKFVLPDKRKKDELADAARDFATQAEAVKDEFLSYEMSPDFLEKLQEKLAAYEAAQSPVKTGGRGRRGAGSNEELDKGLKALGGLEVIVGNKYRGQDDVLAQWKAVSTGIELPKRRGRKPGRKAAAAPAPVPAPPTGKRRPGRPRKVVA